MEYNVLVRKIKQSTNGITLIALVVTIVVLLILAGISIKALTGDRSIVKQATEAQIRTELSSVKEAIEIYKIQKHSDDEMSDEELVEDGLLKEVFIKDTYRTVGVITNLKTIDIQGKLGKSGAKQEETEVGTIQDLYDVYGIDMEDGTLYYIRNGIWSIEGRKVKYTADTGEEKEGYTVETINERYLEDAKFITEWTVEAGQTITLPIMEEPNITIEWGADDNGDGELDIEKCTTTKPTHTYTVAGTYVIKISGNMTNWSFGQNGGAFVDDESKGSITKLNQWGKTGLKQINFWECSNLSGTIPSHKLSGEFSKLTSALEMFRNCKKLTGDIPSDLFKDAIQISGFIRCFSNCSGLAGKIPENLFIDCINATNFQHTFEGCTSLTGNIPANLFANNTKANYFNATFQSCTGLTGEIPVELFRNNTEITNLVRIFEHCKGITGKIPEGLFASCSKIISLGLAFSNTSITEIPIDIFDINNGKANGITDLSGVFQGTKITTVPEGLFDLCTEVTNFGNEWSYSGIFQNCELIESIPDKLFYNNTKVTSFANAFNGCTNLKEIPENIFNTSENVSMYCTFNNCKSLTKISGKIFKNVPNITSLWGTFGECTELVEIGEEFTISNSVTHMDNTFWGCSKLSKFPSKIIIPESVIGIKGTFYNCYELKTTIVLKTNSAEYESKTFRGLNSSSRVNWSSPCTEEFIDVVLEESNNTAIKGVEE